MKNNTKRTKKQRVCITQEQYLEFRKYLSQGLSSVCIQSKIVFKKSNIERKFYKESNRTQRLSIYGEISTSTFLIIFSWKEKYEDEFKETQMSNRHKNQKASTCINKEIDWRRKRQNAIQSFLEVKIFSVRKCESLKCEGKGYSR